MEGLFFRPAGEFDRLTLADTPVYFFVNPVEYHGPHLSHYTDFAISRGLAKRLHSRLCKAVGDHPYIEGPIIHLGVDPAPGPGSVYTSYGQLKSHILNACRSLVALGAKKVIFMTFHGAPMHNMAIHKGVSYLRSQGVQAYSSLNLVLEELLAYDVRTYAPLELALNAANPGKENQVRNVMQTLNSDFHGGLFETSLCLELAPETVGQHKQVADCPQLAPPPIIRTIQNVARLLGAEHFVRELDFIGRALAWTKLNPCPGYTGSPSLASKSAGAYLVEERILPMYEKAALEVLWRGNPSPRPIMDWLVYLSLGGRILKS